MFVLCDRNKPAINTALCPQPITKTKQTSASAGSLLRSDSGANDMNTTSTSRKAPTYVKEPYRERTLRERKTLATVFHQCAAGKSVASPTKTAHQAGHNREQRNK